MAYCTYSDIEKDFKDITFDASVGNVIQSDVTGFITEADALINSYVSAKYQTPVTSGDGLNLLKMISRGLVTLRVKSILQVKQNTNTSANQAPVNTLFSSDQYIKMLEQIKSGILKLDGATPLVSGGAFYSNNYANGVEPTIKKDKTQW